MAVAPLSQTILLTEDGSAGALAQQVTVPPIVIPTPPYEISSGDVVALML